MSTINYCPNCGHDITQYDMTEFSDNQVYTDALKVVAENNLVKTSLLQRKLRIGYGRAAHIIVQMENEGLIDDQASNGNYKINVKLLKERIEKTQA